MSYDHTHSCPVCDCYFDCNTNDECDENDLCCECENIRLIKQLREKELEIVNLKDIVRLLEVRNQALENIIKLLKDDF